MSEVRLGDDVGAPAQLITEGIGPVGRLGIVPAGKVPKSSCPSRQELGGPRWRCPTCAASEVVPGRCLFLESCLGPDAVVVSADAWIAARETACWDGLPSEGDDVCWEVNA